MNPVSHALDGPLWDAAVADQLSTRDRRATGDQVGAERIIPEPLPARSQEFEVRKRGKEECRPSQLPFPTGEAFRAVSKVRGARPRRDDEHPTELSTIEYALEAALPVGNRRDLVDEDPSNGSVRAECEREAGQLVGQMVCVSQEIAVQKERASGSMLTYGVAKGRFQPGRLPVLASAAHEDHSRLDGKRVEPKVHREDGGRIVQGLETREQARSVEIPCRQRSIHLLNVHAVDTINVLNVEQR